jgi:hypothetical protein
MKALFEHLSVALGTATLSLLFMIGPFVSPDHLVIYHLAGSAASVFVPVAIDVCLLWLAFLILLTLAAKSARLHSFLWSGIILFSPWIFLKNCARLSNWVIPGWISLLAILLPSIVFAAAICVLWGRRRAVFVAVQSFAARLLGLASLVGIAALVQILWFAYQARALNSFPRPLHRIQISANANAHRTRVIWLLLDELSYKQVYEQRFPSVPLPAFDQFAATATVFTQVTPAGNYTDVAVPSLFTGLRVDHIRVSADGDLVALHNPGTGEWNSFDPRQTIFQDALNSGYSTGAVGWYNPYCRILPDVLDHCFWTFRRTFPGGMLSDQSLESNLINPIRHLAGNALFSLSKLSDRSPRLMPMDEVREAQIHIHDYQDIFRATDSLLADPSANFIFLHMPVPHPMGIYDRRLMRFSTGRSSYLDNLVLAGQCLAHVRGVLTKQGQWDSSVVIVMGDHSWRTAFMWAKSPGWTAEEQEASHGGQFDARPVYMVKMPGQHDGLRIDAPFSAVRTRSLLDAILSGRLDNAGQLQSWVAQQRLAGNSTGF